MKKTILLTGLILFSLFSFGQQIRTLQSITTRQNPIGTDVFLIESAANSSYSISIATMDSNTFKTLFTPVEGLFIFYNATKTIWDTVDMLFYNKTDNILELDGFTITSQSGQILNGSDTLIDADAVYDYVATELTDRFVVTELMDTTVANVIQMGTQNTYYVVDSIVAGENQGTAKNNTSITAGTFTIIAANAGFYKISISLSGDIGENGSLSGSVFVDGVRRPRCSFFRTNTGGESDVFCITCILELAATEVVDLRIAHTSNIMEFNVQEFNFNILKID